MPQWELLKTWTTPLLLLVFRRTLVEDRFLRAKLAGYPEYAARVRYRLLPGVW